MPTIDQLNPATVAADDDQVLISQNGASRKISRALLLEGTQPEIALPTRSLLGRASAGTGAAETLAIGTGLTVQSGALTATAGDFDISTLPAGAVPAGVDIVPLGQGGGNVGVSYAQFLSGLPGVSNISSNNMTVKATGSTVTQKMADFAANTLPKSGGQMSGPLVLATDPFLAKQASTKQYSDAADALRVLRAGDSMTGPLTLPADPTSALHASTKQYVDSGDTARIARSGDAMSGPLTLAGDPTAALGAATKQYVDTANATRVDKAGDTMTGALTLPGNPTQPLQAASKQYVDTADTARVQKAGDSMTGPLTLSANPTQPLHAAAKQYVDAADTARVQKAGDAMTGALSLSADPTAPLHASTKQYVDAHFQSYPGVGWSNGSDDTLRLQSYGRYGIAPAGHAEARAYYLPAYAGGTPGAVQNAFQAYTQIAGAPNDFHWTILAVVDYGGSGGTGQHVAHYAQAVRRTYNPGSYTNNPELWAATFEYVDLTNQPSSVTNQARAIEIDFKANGADDGDSFGFGLREIVSVVAVRTDPNGAALQVGKGIGFYSEGASNPSTVNRASYRRVVHVGANFTVAAFDTLEATQQSGAHAIWLRDGHDVALNSAGTAFLRYSGNSITVNGAPLRLPSFTVAALPAAPGAGAKAFASNGRKPAEGAGAGTGVEVYHDGTRWNSVSSSTQVAA